ncbi:MAG: ATP-binding protein [Anaerolineae bacterium]|nr:ATP-binding protein [Anaerolineae bacterium]
MDGEQTALLVSIGRHAGAAVVNAQHYQDALSRERMSRVLSGLGMAVSATLDEQEVLDMICRESTAIFGVESALVSLVEGDELVVAAAHGQGMAAYLGSRERIFIGRSLGARVVVARKPQYENRVPQLVRGEAPAWLAETGTQAKLGVPMIRDGEAVGAIVLVSTHTPDRFCEEDLELANLLAIQAALALQNARLYAEVNRRLEFGRLVGEVGRASTAILSEAAMMQGVCQRIYEAFGYDIIALFQCAPAENAGEAARPAALTTQAVYIDGAAVDASALDADVVPLHVVERAARRAESVLISAGLRVTDTPERAGRTDLAVPFVMGEDVLGVLAITRLEPNAIDESEVDLLQTLAAQLAISLSNARLFDTVRRQRDELEDRVRARTAEIAAQKEQTEAILRSVPDAVIVADLGGAIVMTNPPAAHLLEKPETEHNVREWVAALVTDDDDALREMELSGQVYQATASRVVQGGTELGTVVVVRDITRLYELDRLKSQFVSTVSHELRTPLTNIKLYLSLLQQGKPERQQSYIQVIDRESRRLERLVADLLDLSRLERQAEPPQREMLDIACVINAVLDNYAIQAELKRQTLAFVPDGLLPTVNADRNQLIQVFTNLVGNAVQYTPEGGRVTVRACATGRVDAPAVCVAVSDTGPGIPPEEIDRIFDRFYRGSNVAADAAPGTGLGLAIVREIINLHCGTIEVSSQVGEGSTFTVVLPAALPK